MFNPVFDGAAIDLLAMLDAREKRSLRQHQLFQQFPQATLLCATLNIPGPIKRSEVLRSVFDRVMEEVVGELHLEQILFQKVLDQDTGIELYLVTQQEAKTVKQLMMEIEESKPIGRLFDLDVLEMKAGEVTGLSRSAMGYPTRRCFMCNEDAKECGRSRKHSVEEMQQKIEMLIKEYMKEDDYGENPNN